MHFRSMNILVASVALSLVVASTGFGQAFEGMGGDGVSDFIFDFMTGEVTVDPDGENVGGFQIVSASGIFTGDAATLPAGLFPSDSDTEIGLGSLNAATGDAFSLGNVAQSGLTLAFLLGDLTTTRGSGGLGTPNRTFGTIVVNENGGGGTPALGANPASGSGIDFGVLLPGVMSAEQMASVSNTGDGGLVSITGAPSLSGADSALFEIMGSDNAQLGPGASTDYSIKFLGANAEGNYAATATIGTDLGDVTYNLTAEVRIPEPSAMALFGLALVGLVGYTRRR